MKANPKVVRVNDRIDSSLYHFRVEFQDVLGRGFGSDESENIALLKAFSEATERFVFQRDSRHSVGATSSGFAAHSELNKAIEASQMELIERDAFLMIWLSGKHPQWLEGTVNILNNVHQGTTRAGFTSRFGLLATWGNSQVWIGVLDASKHGAGYAISTSIAKNMESAISTISNDLRRAANLVLSRTSEGEGFGFSGEVISAGDTLEYYLNAENREPIDEFLSRSESALVMGDVSIASTGVNHGLYDLPWEIHVAQSTSVNLQTLFFGSPRPENINLNRFSRLGLRLTRHQVNPLP